LIDFKKTTRYQTEPDEEDGDGLSNRESKISLCLKRKKAKENVHQSTRTSKEHCRSVRPRTCVADRSFPRSCWSEKGVQRKKIGKAEREKRSALEDVVEIRDAHRGIVDDLGTSACELGRLSRRAESLDVSEHPLKDGGLRKGREDRSIDLSSEEETRSDLKKEKEG
jgi:hypothetical protein